MCGQQPSCYPIGYQLNSRINCPRSSPCLRCRMKSIKENEGHYQDSPWGRKYDELETDPQMRPWRNRLVERHGCEFFSLEPESINVAPALTRWLQKRLPQNDTAAELLEPRVPPHFIGREDLMTQLENALAQNSWCGLFGIGG